MYWAHMCYGGQPVFGVNWINVSRIKLGVITLPAEKSVFDALGPALTYNIYSVVLPPKTYKS